jgi:hypothetical protein
MLTLNILFYNLIAVIIILFGLIISMFCINRITLFLYKQKINKTVLIIIHLFLISLAFRVVYDIFNTLIPDETNVYIMTSFFVSVIISSSSKFIKPYLKSLHV